MKKTNALRPHINKTKSLYRINEMLQLYNNQLKADKTLFFKLCFLKKKSNHGLIEKSFCRLKMHFIDKNQLQGTILLTYKFTM